jgi:hypothetical protein
MKKVNLKSIISYLIGAVLVFGGVALADKLIPTSDTSAPTMFTLEDIWKKTQNLNYTTSDHDISTTSAPIEPGTMKTLADIWQGLTDFVLPPTSKVEDGYFYGPNSSLEGELSTGATVLTWETPVASDSPSYIDWNVATDYCANLTEGNVTPGTWRLPYVEELIQESPIANPNFTQVGGFKTDKKYWSIVTNPSNSSYAYSVRVSGGGVNLSSKTGSDVIVRCVR